MTQQELDGVLQSGEGQKIEFKRNVNSDLAKEMVAFANSNGGRLYIGIDDDNTIHGTDTGNGPRSRIMDIARECDPSLDITLEVFKHILVVTVPESKNKPHRCSSGFYMRVGPNSVKLTTSQIIGFIKTEGKVRFDELQLPGAKFPGTLNQTALARYSELSSISNTTGTEQLLTNLGVLEHTDAGAVFNHAGVLFFGQNPTAFIPQSAVTCVAYKGNTKVHILDKKTFEFNLIANIDEALAFVKRHLNVSFEITGKRRKEKLEIPEVALREAVVNAVAHRDYFEKGANVMIEVFDNRVEISNPGGLPKGLKPEDFGKRTLARNPLLAGLLNRAGYIEKLGTGIPRIKQVLEEANLPEPEFIFDDFFTVSIRRYSIEAGIKRELKVTDQKSARIAYIMRQLSAGAFNVEDVALELVTTSRTIRNDLDLLAEHGWIKVSGSTKGREYSLSDKGKERLAKWG